MNELEQNSTFWKHFWLPVPLTLVLIVWVADLQISAELSLFVFNLVPIGLVAWYFGAKRAYTLACFSAALWFLSDVYVRPWFSNRFLLGLNITLKMALFLSAAYFLSKLKAALDTLAERNRQLAEANEMKTLFLGMASHDLRSPLSGILLTADLLEYQLEEPNPELAEARTNLARLTEAGVRLKRMLDNYLDYARIESGGFVARPRPVPLSDWIAGVVDAELMLARTRDIRIETSMATSEHEWSFDPDLMELALVNLFSNALKYTPAGSTVTVEFTNSNGDHAIRVKDQGPGLGEFAGVAFERFRHQEGKRLSGEKSTGLGLYIVQKVAQAHGGTTRGYDLPAGGACIEVQIPRSPGADPA